MKKPILFDDHDASVTELLYFVDTRIGRKTCMARCEHCWLDKPHLNTHRQDLGEAMHVIGRLRDRGFTVSPIVSDSFAESGLYLRSGLFRGNEDWYMGDAAWSSGRPLLEDNWRELLGLCVENRIDTIIMTSHGTEDGERPFRGLTQPRAVRRAIRRIRRYERGLDHPFRIVLTFTLGKQNSSARKIREYLEYSERIGIDVARFNQFTDTKGDHPDNRLSQADVAETYRALKETYDAFQGKVQMSVSEDFGFRGVEVMGFPEGVGHCVAGERFFGVVYPYVYVCPVNLTVVAGTVDQDGAICWDDTVLAQVLRAKEHPEFNGCLGVDYPHSAKIREYFQGGSLSGPSGKVA